MGSHSFSVPHARGELIRRCLPCLTVFALAATAIVATAVTPSRADDPPAVTVTVTRTVTSTYRGKPARVWAARYRTRTRQLQQARAASRSLRRTLVTRPSVSEALALACVAYRTSCSRVYWIASCESGLNSGAKNPEPRSDASGLGQFLSGTWASTPYGRFSVFSPYANALAIAYEVALGNSHAHWQASESCWGRH